MRYRPRRVPTKDNAVSDTVAISALGISRSTFFRLLQKRILSEPVPVNGTQRRWWSASDLQSAKDAIRMHRGKESNS